MIGSVFLAFRRFLPDRLVDYQHIQAEAIRKYADGRQFLTSNYIGWNHRFDHYILAEELDLAAWDNYISTGHLDPLRNGFMHDMARGFKRKNFWLMESQSTNTDWSLVNNALDRGEVRAMAWHAVGHGADAVSFWQWRRPLSGVEQYFGVLVGPDGRPNPVYQEIAAVGADFAKAGDALAGTTPDSTVALLHDYSSRWAVDYALRPGWGRRRALRWPP
jgi:beta-galactosidase